MERKKPMGKRVTLADIAKVAGVTPATVQRALKGLEGVGDEQRQNILRVATEMNYGQPVGRGAGRAGRFLRIHGEGTPLLL